MVTVGEYTFITSVMCAHSLISKFVSTHVFFLPEEDCSRFSSFQEDIGTGHQKQLLFLVSFQVTILRYLTYIQNKLTLAPETVSLKE
jgi:hypothetical protein